MLTGWVCLYLFLVYVLTDGGKIQGWHSAVWIVTTFLGMFAVVGSQGSVGGRRWSASSLWQQLKIALALTMVGLALPILFSWILSHFTDFSWDGMTSLGITVWNLKEGKGRMINLPFGQLSAGFLAFLTSSWQGGKGIHLVLLWICFCFVFASLKCLGFRGWRLGMLSLVATLNPVAIYQISSFQIDGHVACLFSILTFSLLRVLASEPGSHDGWVATGLAFLCLAAAKTSGVFYGSAVLGIFALFWLGKKLVVKKEGVVLVGLLGLLICAGLALRSWGQNRALSWDYLRQAMGSGPGYGFGGGASEIEAIRRMSPLEKFASSAFSRTEISVSEARIKLPFELGRRELRVFEELTPDPRAGGFGPWYGTALLLAGLGCLMLVFDGRVAYWPGWFLFLATAASSFGSQVWWARWTPQNWLLLVAMLMTMFAPQPQSGSAEASAVGKVRRLQDAGLRVLAGLACWATLVNVLLVAFYYGVGMVRQEKILNRQIQMAAQMRGRVLLHIPFEMQGHKRGASFKASRLWFVDRKIPTKLLPKIPRTPRMKLNKTNTWILLAPNWRKFLLDPMDERLFRERGLIED